MSLCTFSARARAVGHHDVVAVPPAVVRPPVSAAAVATRAVAMVIRYSLHTSVQFVTVYKADYVVYGLGT